MARTNNSKYLTYSVDNTLHTVEMVSDKWILLLINIYNLSYWLFFNLWSNQNDNIKYRSLSELEFNQINL